MKVQSSKTNEISLWQRVVHAGSWVTGAFVLGQVFRFVSNLALTRLLVPEMFGVMAVVTVIQIGLAMMSDVGLMQNIVQSRRGHESYFQNTAWVVQILRGVFLSLLMLTLSWLLSAANDAGWVADGSVYAAPVLPDVLTFMAMNVLLEGFYSTKRHLAARSMSLALLSMIELGAQVFGILVMVAVAWVKPSIWALVSGSIVTTLVTLILSHVVLPGSNNRLQWDTSSFWEIIDLGKWLFVTSVLGFVVTQGDRLLLGGLISPAMLGIFSIAYFLANAVILLFNKVSVMVFFPAFSEVLRSSPENIKDVYYKIRLKIDGITFFGAGFLFVSGQMIINQLYDSRYHEAGWMLQILSLSLVSVGFLISGQCFVAYGKAKLLMLLSFFRGVVLFVFLPLMYFSYGLKGAIVVVAVSPILTGLVALVFMHRLGLLCVWREFIMLPVFFFGVLLGKFLVYLACD